MLLWCQELNYYERQRSFMFSFSTIGLIYKHKGCQLLISASASYVQIVSLVATGCLEDGNCHRIDASYFFFYANITALMIAHSSFSFVFLVPPHLHDGWFSLLWPTVTNTRQLPYPSYWSGGQYACLSIFFSEVCLWPLSLSDNCFFCNQLCLWGTSTHNIIHIT